MSASITVSGASAGEPAGSSVFGPETIVGIQTIGSKTLVSLSLGDNTIPVPSGAVCAWVQGPTNGSAVLKLRTSANSSDAGLQINGTGYPTIYPFPTSAPSSLIINASASGPVTVIFI